MINLFITAVGGDIACATLRALKRAKGLCNLIVGGDTRLYNQGLLYIDSFEIAPPYTDEKIYKKYIIDVCNKYKINYFWPMTEYEIDWVDKNRLLFDNIDVFPIIQTHEMLNIARSKYLTAIKLREFGINTPNTILIDDNCNKQVLIDTVGIPMVIKKNNGCGSKGIVFIETIKDFENISIKEYIGYVAQELVGTADDEYTVGLFSDGNNPVIIPYKRKLGFGGMSIEVETVADKELIETMINLAKKINLKGSINVQLRKHHNKYYVFEINPRISSSVGFRDSMGFHDALWWLKLCKDSRVEADFKLIEGLKGIKILDEFVFNKVY